MNRTNFSFSGQGGTALAAVLWMPEGEVKAVLQIAHGMTEHMGRYEAFAQSLLPLGIAVAGFNLRGHGSNPGDPRVASFREGGWEASLADMHLFFTYLHRRFPGVPHYLLGFSLGSFLLREYLGQYSNGIAGAIIMGTGHQSSGVLSVIRCIVRSQIRKAGFDQTTPLVRQLSFGTYNQSFCPNRTEADWLCADQQSLDQYLADPLVRRDISSGLFYELLGSMQRTGRRQAYLGWDCKTPILLLSGQDDPVGGSGKGVHSVYQQMHKAGLTNVTLRLFPGARHDLLHESANGTAEAACRCIADFLLKG